MIFIVNCSSLNTQRPREPNRAPRALPWVFLAVNNRHVFGILCRCTKIRYWGYGKIWRSRKVVFVENAEKFMFLFVYNWQSYKLCERWQEEVDDNPESYREKEMFVNSQRVKNLLEEVSERVGFDVDFADVHLIYNICAFETAWFPDSYSPWCSLLSLDNFKVFSTFFQK